MYLIDTMVLSELGKPRSHPGVVDWMKRTQLSPTFISVMTIGEIVRHSED